MSQYKYAEGPYQKWMCLICGYIYDEAIGDPEHKLPPGTRWSEIPNSWQCPDCNASKLDFVMVEV